MLCIWSTVSGDILSAIQVSGTSEINFIKYDEFSHTILVCHNFGMTVLKFGDIDKILKEEKNN